MWRTTLILILKEAINLGCKTSRALVLRTLNIRLKNNGSVNVVKSSYMFWRPVLKTGLQDFFKIHFCPLGVLRATPEDPLRRCPSTNDFGILRFAIVKYKYETMIFEITRCTTGENNASWKYDQKYFIEINALRQYLNLVLSCGLPS